MLLINDAMRDELIKPDVNARLADAEVYLDLLDKYLQNSQPDVWQASREINSKLSALLENIFFANRFEVCDLLFVLAECLIEEVKTTGDRETDFLLAASCYKYIIVTKQLFKPPYLQLQRLIWLEAKAKSETIIIEKDATWENFLERNKSVATYLARLAEDKNVVSAAFMLGTMYYFGNSAVKQNNLFAVKYFGKEIQKNNSYKAISLAMLQLAAGHEKAAVNITDIVFMLFKWDSRGFGKYGLEFIKKKLFAITDQNCDKQEEEFIEKFTPEFLNALLNLAIDSSEATNGPQVATNEQYRTIYEMLCTHLYAFPLVCFERKDSTVPDTELLRRKLKEIALFAALSGNKSDQTWLIKIFHELMNEEASKCNTIEQLIKGQPEAFASVMAEINLFERLADLASGVNAYAERRLKKLAGLIGSTYLELNPTIYQPIILQAARYNTKLLIKVKSFLPGLIEAKTEASVEASYLLWLSTRNYDYLIVAVKAGHQRALAEFEDQVQRDYLFPIQALSFLIENYLADNTLRSKAVALIDRTVNRDEGIENKLEYAKLYIRVNELDKALALLSFEALTGNTKVLAFMHTTSLLPMSETSFILGYVYAFGIGQDCDIDESCKYFKNVITNANANNKVKLAQMYCNILTGKEDIDELIKVLNTLLTKEMLEKSDYSTEIEKAFASKQNNSLLEFLKKEKQDIDERYILFFLTNLLIVDHKVLWPAQYLTAKALYKVLVSKQKEDINRRNNNFAKLIQVIGHILSRPELMPEIRLYAYLLELKKLRKEKFLLIKDQIEACSNNDVLVDFIESITERERLLANYLAQFLLAIAYNKNKNSQSARRCIQLAVTLFNSSYPDECPPETLAVLFDLMRAVKVLPQEGNEIFKLLICEKHCENVRDLLFTEFPFSLLIAQIKEKQLGLADMGPYIDQEYFIKKHGMQAIVAFLFDMAKQGEQLAEQYLNKLVQSTIWFSFDKVFLFNLLENEAVMTCMSNFPDQLIKLLLYITQPDQLTENANAITYKAFEKHTVTLNAILAKADASSITTLLSSKFAKLIDMENFKLIYNSKFIEKGIAVAEVKSLPVADNNSAMPSRGDKSYFCFFTPVKTNNNNSVPAFPIDLYKSSLLRLLEAEFRNCNDHVELKPVINVLLDNVKQANTICQLKALNKKLKMAEWLTVSGKAKLDNIAQQLKDPQELVHQYKINIENNNSSFRRHRV
jgi:TPR repeat protein